MEKKYLLALALILALAAGLRFTNLDWDNGAHQHPDERFLTMVASGIEFSGNYFDSEASGLNPYNKGYDFFVYGTFPLFLAKSAGDIFGFAGYEGYYLVGRFLSGLFDMLTIIIIFLVAKELFGIKAGLLAAFFLAAAVIHIQHSHFFVVDLFSAFFIALSFYFLVMLVKTEKPLYIPLLGASWGLAAASKISALLFAPIILLGLLMILSRKIKSEKTAASACKIIVLGLLAVMTAFIIFRIFQPYAFIGPSIWGTRLSPQFVSNLKMLAAMNNISNWYPPAYQWIGRHCLFQMQNLLFWGFGIFLGILSMLGLLFGIYRLYKKDARCLLVVSWILLVIIYQAFQFAKPLRYLLPATPFLALLGAAFLAELNSVFRRKIRKKIIAAVILIFLIGSLAWALAFTSIYSGEISRVKASEWIYENVPADSTIANEHWDDEIPLNLQGKTPEAYNHELLTLYDADTDEKIINLSAQLAETDYIFITSSRLYKSIPRAPEKYPYTTRYYQLLFNESLGFRLEKTFTNYPSLLGIEISDDNAEESFTVYDHPKVLVFKKESRLSSSEIMGLIKNE